MKAHHREKSFSSKKEGPGVVNDAGGLPLIIGSPTDDGYPSNGSLTYFACLLPIHHGVEATG